MPRLLLAFARSRGASGSAKLQAVVAVAAMVGNTKRQGRAHRFISVRGSPLLFIQVPRAGLAFLGGMLR